jgi:hypothetical protein
LQLVDRFTHVDAVELHEIAQGPPGGRPSSDADDAALHEKPDRGGMLLDELLDRYLRRDRDFLHGASSPDEYAGCALS